MRIIKRYSNRKLYDTLERRYVTLDDVARMVRQGNELRIEDHESGEDLTGPTLSQIIAERERRGETILPNRLLALLLQGGSHIRRLVRDRAKKSIGRLDSVLQERARVVLRHLQLAESSQVATLEEKLHRLEARIEQLARENRSSRRRK